MISAYLKTLRLYGQNWNSRGPINFLSSSRPDKTFLSVQTGSSRGRGGASSVGRVLGEHAWSPSWAPSPGLLSQHFRSRKEVNLKFEVVLGYIGSSRPAHNARDFVSWGQGLKDGEDGTVLTVVVPSNDSERLPPSYILDHDCSHDQWLILAIIKAHAGKNKQDMTWGFLPTENF